MLIDPKPITREEAIEILKQQQSSGDKEDSHREADDVLRRLLWHLGYDDVVREYDKCDKWFE